MRAGYLVLITAMMCVGCGQTGPLYLPKLNKSSTQPKDSTQVSEQASQSSSSSSEPSKKNRDAASSTEVDTH
jgi:predicted small lipoprotein YifL